MPPLFGLAPGGVYRAAAVASDAVRSCRTLSTLPVRSRAESFLWHYPSEERTPPAGRYPAPLFRGARTFLVRASSPAAARPSGGGDIGERHRSCQSAALVSVMAGRRTLRLSRPIPLPGGKFGKAIRDSVLQVGVVGIQANLLPGDGFKLRRQLQEKFLRGRMDRARSLDPTSPRPLGGMGERISCRNLHRDPA